LNNEGSQEGIWQKLKDKTMLPKWDSSNNHVLFVCDSNGKKEWNYKNIYMKTAPNCYPLSTCPNKKSVA
jgi:hypothetical protein